MDGNGVVLFLFTGLIIVVLVVLFQRYQNSQLLHRERMAALEKGVAVPLGRVPAPVSPRVYLLRGLIWSLTGLALMICLFGLSISSHRAETAEDRMWRAGNIARSTGISIEQARTMEEQDDAGLRGVPLSVSLLGLIPLAVGIAYLAFYYTDESRKVQVPEPAPARTSLNLS